MSDPVEMEWAELVAAHRNQADENERLKARIEKLETKVNDLRGRGNYLVAEVKDAWEKGQISVDTFHAALSLEQITNFAAADCEVDDER